MLIKNILIEIATESSTNKKMAILSKYKDNETLKEVLYLAESKRVKFYIKQVPSYIPENLPSCSLEFAIDFLKSEIITRNVTGNNAISDISDMLSSLNNEDAYVIERIIKKDLKIGMGSTNINKVIGKNFIEKTPYMGAVSFKEKIAQDIVKGVAMSQVKMDGRYCNALLNGEILRLESRGGEPSYLEGAKFLNELKSINENVVLNGELTMDNVTRYKSNGIIASCISIGKKSSEGKDITKDLMEFEKKHKMSYENALDKIIFTVWDVIAPEEYADNKSNVKYLTRLLSLGNLLKKYSPTMIRQVESLFVDTYEDAMNHFIECLNAGEEGTILKSSNGTWKDGKPKWQCKMKLEMDLDMEIIGFNMGTVGSKNEHVVSSITVQSSDGIVKTSPAGMSEDDMEYVTKNQEDLMGKIVKVKCSGLSENSKGIKSLLHPVFIEIRDDKDIADSYDQMVQIENMKKILS